jgi:ribose-phosphate pyrophosphokinase
LAYARKDRRTKPFDPLSLRHLAQLFEAAGVQRLIALEVHDAAAFENAFRCPIVHVRASCVFDALFNDLSGSVGSLAVEQPQVAPVQTDFAMAPGAACWVVASPDPGGVKRAQLWRESLQTRLGHELGFAMLDKRRSAGVVSTDDLVAGDVKGAQVLLYDDLISSGGTMRRAAQALRTHGADRVVAVAAHGLFAQHAQDLLAEPALDAVVVSDSVPSMRHCAAAQGAGRLRVMSAARPLARAIDSLSR